MGFAEHGNYLQWPAMSWQRGDYDPRFRPWYAMIASGPKTVIIVIDVSGSMQSANRLPLARDAAVKVLDTLTWFDFVGVMAFSTGVKRPTASPVPATDVWKKTLTKWIRDLQHDASTNYRAALAAAFDWALSAAVFEKGDSDPDRCFSAACKTAILFLSDGAPDVWTEADYRELQGRVQKAASVMWCK